MILILSRPASMKPNFSQSLNVRLTVKRVVPVISARSWRLNNNSTSVVSCSTRLPICEASPRRVRAIRCQFTIAGLNILNESGHQARKPNSQIGTGLHHFVQEFTFCEQCSTVLNGLCVGRVCGIFSNRSQRGKHFAGQDRSDVHLFAARIGLKQLYLTAG